MSRRIRFSILIFAVAMTALGVAIEIPKHGREIWDSWLLAGGLCAAYLVLALGFFFSRAEDGQLSVGWRIAMVVLSASQVTPCISENGASFENYMKDAVVLISAGAYLFVSLWIYGRLRSGSPNFGASSMRKIAWGAWIAGAALVLSTLFLNTTLESDGVSMLGTLGDASKSGLMILLGHARWVTGYVNVGHDATTGTAEIPWLQPVFAIAGYGVYLMIVLATLVMAGLVIRSRLLGRDIRVLKVFATFSTVFAFCSFWIYTDIYWGWHFELSDSPALAVCAAGMWIAGPVLFLAVLCPRPLWGFDRGRVRTILLFQAPVAVFNCFPLPLYFSELKLEGLAVLMAGVQLQSWGCIALAAGSEAEVSAEREAEERGMSRCCG
jgi:hypothetical protein